MERVVNIGASVEYNNELSTAFIAHLRGALIGGESLDKAYYDAQIERAENNAPDRKELTSFLMSRAGFESEGGIFANFADFKR